MIHPGSSFYNFRPLDHILLLGCTGLFGKHLLPRLNSFLTKTDLAPEVTLVTRNIKQTLACYPFLKSINLLENDFLRSTSLVLSRPPTHVLHMANTSASDTFNGASQYSKYKLLSNSVEAIRSVARPRITKKILFTSSGVAYGRSQEYLEADCSLINVYDSSFSLGFAKLNAEFMLSSLCEEIDANLIVARCFSFISPFLPPELHYAIGNFVHCAVNRRNILIKGDGLDLRSYQHVEDAIDWLLLLFHSEPSASVINIGSDESISIKDLAFMIRDLICPNISVTVLNEPADPHNFRRKNYVPSLINARRLGLHNHINLETSILELAAFISKNPVDHHV